MKLHGFKIVETPNYRGVLDFAESIGFHGGYKGEEQDGFFCQSL